MPVRGPAAAGFGGGSGWRRRVRPGPRERPVARGGAGVAPGGGGLLGEVAAAASALPPPPASR